MLLIIGVVSLVLSVLLGRSCGLFYLEHSELFSLQTYKHTGYAPHIHEATHRLVGTLHAPTAYVTPVCSFANFDRVPVFEALEGTCHQCPSSHATTTLLILIHLQ